ncbi:MAG: DEAD/DEAH box helicase family protein [Candidatus Gracilibacteria bacterium]|nr:DEAD/DEAH box helicase family protein [Candidatus Gracilibacteria bacterium]
MAKGQFSETDVCSKFITPALHTASWSETQIRREVSFTKGRIKVKGKTVSRGETKRADYILYYKSHLPIAIVEAKDDSHSIGDGMQQALGYAETLDIPFVYSSNGDGFLEHDRTKTSGAIEREIRMEEFPSPEELYKRYRIAKGLDEEIEKTIMEPYYEDGGGKGPRYYQQIAINRTIEAVAKGQDRILLVMATGTGKTYTAFQIIWRLWKARKKKRILFLADRNILVDQTITNDFKPFGDKMTKIENRKVDTAYEIYLALYQGLTGGEEDKNVFRQFSPNFFDLIVIDECHRGSARENSEWRAILDYFKGATQIGLTATPKETEDVSTHTYFGDPIYTYSLKQGIEDGFLAPYKVIRVGMDVDEGWRPFKGQLDYNGTEIPDKVYELGDFDRNIVIRERTEAVAKKISDYLKSTDRYSKTIVFCVDIDHAERMRQALVNENADEVAKNPKYVMRITGDNEEGKMELDNFIDPKERYPVIATTSKLLTTGVDAQTCRVIALDSVINSMTEFKQIIGRGTRINEAFGKYYFTILDFRKATNKFADPDFDGEPVVIYKPGPNDPIDGGDVGGVGKDEGTGEGGTVITGGGEGGGNGQKKIVVRGVPVSVSQERIQYIGPDGKLITESLKDYSKKNILSSYASLDDFLNEWNHVDRKLAVVSALEEKGVFFEDLQKEVGQDYDPFDMICHLAYDRPPMTRKQRAEKAKKGDYFEQYGEQAREILNMLLEKYADEGIDAIEDMNVLKISPLSRLGSPIEIVSIFGGKEKYQAAVRALETALYQ